MKKINWLIIVKKRTESLKELEKSKRFVGNNNKTQIRRKKYSSKSCPARAVVLLSYCGINNRHVSYVAEQPILKLGYIHLGQIQEL